VFRYRILVVSYMTRSRTASNQTPFDMVAMGVNESNASLTLQWHELRKGSARP
jgi:hypothetical protein